VVDDAVMNEANDQNDQEGIDKIVINIMKPVIECDG
jgi:hypothetical protein